MRRHCAVLLPALLALLLGSTPAAGAPAAKRGTLTADTTIQWRGNAGIRLAANGGALPWGSLSLFLTRGTFAFAILLDDPQPAECHDGQTLQHCHGFAVLKVPGTEHSSMDRSPGGGYLEFSSISRRIAGRHLDVYLFTDGAATLRLRPEGRYRGRSAYVAAGRVRGLAQRLPGSCADLCHRTPASELAAGGAAFDFGNRLGHLMTVGYTSAVDEVEHVPSDHPAVAESCFYPTPWEPAASADPADYPRGCPMLPTDGDDPINPVVQFSNALQTGAGGAHMWRVSDQRGKRYAGFYAGHAAALERTYNHGHAVWFNYGIT